MGNNDNFEYSKDIEEIDPIVFNLSLNKTDKGIQGELRKRFLIKEVEKAFWMQVFEASLKGKPIQAKIKIVFRDPLLSAIKLKELNLLEQELKLVIDEKVVAKK